MTTATLIGDAPTTNVAAPTQDAQTLAAPVADASASTTPTPTVEATTQVDPAAAKPGDAASAKPERAAPEKYEFTMPDGQKANPEIIAEFEAIARELKMPQDEAQTLVGKLAPKISERVIQQQAEMIERASNEWAATATADKEYGGDKLTENLALGEKALTTFGTPELRQMLVDSRLGNHPEVIRFMVRAGKALSEDNRFVTNGAAPGQLSSAQRMYPNMNP